MKFLIVLALVAGAFAAPNAYGSSPAFVRASSFPAAAGYESPALVKEFHQIPILRQVLDDDNYGTYNLQFESGNGIHNSESGQLRDLGGPFSEGPVSVKSGAYSYISPEGIPISTTWVADEGGFRASGAHLPVPPPMPAEIARSLSGGYGAAPAPALRFSSGYSSSSPALLLKSSAGY